jgi:transposase
MDGRERYELSDAQWRRVAALLPGKAGDPGRRSDGISSQPRRESRLSAGKHTRRITNSRS